jgi:NAD(P)H-dependent FMN reductase
MAGEMTPPRLLIIIASTRPGRIGLPVGLWFEQRARARGGFEVEVADLAELRLPLMDEPNHPRLRQYTHEHTRRWSATVEAADAFALVMPEYNYSYTAPLKNALDYLHQEWNNKPVGIVSYGGVAAGARAAVALAPVLLALQMRPLALAVQIPFVAQFLDDEGEIHGNEVMDQAADAVLAELERLAGWFRGLRRSSGTEG